ncbi:MAG: penicillin acylase family protein [SAR202 cluster bacterium]|nr:penicillin acylase family protein [SAR202 cluster bacterium]
MLGAMGLYQAAFGLLLGRRMPRTSGTLAAPGLKGVVVIRRDRYGIPHIEAESDEDAWYGLGFCHGQDRAFQLEISLRVARGTVSELVGKAGLPTDLLARRIGFNHSAARQWAALDPDVSQALEAYAKGVTDGATLGSPRRAHEFALLKIRPTPYTGVDALAVAKVYAFGLSSNWSAELARYHVLQGDGPEALRAVDPSYPEWLPVTMPDGGDAGTPVDRLSGDLALLAAAAGVSGGSNNWVLAASRTATGRPILANDPHLPAELPPYWYLAHVRTREWAVAGATLAGTPAFAAGHNGHAAWGVTAGMADNTDLFIEEVGPDGVTIRAGDASQVCVVRKEVIAVKGGEPVVENVLVTPRGPIIAPPQKGETKGLSLAAVWLEPRPAAGLLRIHRVRSFEEFRQAFAQWPLMSLNMVYADVSSSIGWQLVGEVPVRRDGYGTMPLPGWGSRPGWEDSPVPFGAMPYAANPACGFLVTSNAKPVRDDSGPFFGVDWIDGYRQARITEQLATRSDWDVASTLRLQTDTLSIPWREVRNAVLAMQTGDSDAKRGLTLLQAWDGVLAGESPAASVFVRFVAEMTRRVVEAKAPNSVAWALGKSDTPVMEYTVFVLRRVGYLSRLLRQQPDGWFAGGWPAEMADALAAAVRDLRFKYGASTDSWAWGKVRPLVLKHRVGERKPLDKVFNRGPFPIGGDTDTVAQASCDPLNPYGNPLFVASMRMVVDVGNWEASQFSLPGGQSGNPLSPHYDDLLRLWLRGDGVPMAWSQDSVARATRRTLRLVPSPPTSAS